MTLPDGSGGKPQREAEAEAVVWMALKYDPQWSRAAEVAHRRWLLASEVNRRAWRVATDVWEEEMAPTRARHALLQSPVESDQQCLAVEFRAVSAGYSVKARCETTWPVKAGRGVHLAHRRQFFGVFKRLLPAVRTLALLTIVLATSPVGPRFELENGSELNRATEVGQRAVVALEDLSVLHLNTDTSVTIREGPRHREIVLAKGEVFAEVRHDDRRPFRVAIGHVVVEDLGTEFDVSTDEGQTRITVIKGEVRIRERRDDGGLVDPFVASSGESKRESAILGVGDVVKIKEGDDGTATVYKEPRDTAEATRRIQWLQGRLDFNGQSLAEVVREFNRYNPQRLIIDDPGIAELRIGGNYRFNDLNGFVDALRVADRIKATFIGTEGGSALEIHLRGPHDGKRQR